MSSITRLNLESRELTSELPAEPTESEPGSSELQEAGEARKIHTYFIEHHQSLKDSNEIKKKILELVQKAHPLHTSTAQEALVVSVLNNLWGMGPIEKLFEQEDVSEIMINGPGPVWIERLGELQQSQIKLDKTAIENLIERILAPLGLRADRTCPTVDARLNNGARVSIVLPPLAIDGPYITIRRFIKRNFEVSDFASAGLADFLSWAVLARANILVCGGTSSGKTTLINALAGDIPINHRVITIEDAAELSLKNSHILRLETRPSNSEGVGKVEVRDLLKASLRMRPDRILVGEVRGSEALDMLQAMNTGHEGSISSCHSNGIQDALSRLETMVMTADSGLSLEAVRSQIASALDFLIHLRRQPGGDRKIVEVAEISKSANSSEITVRTLGDSSGLLALSDFVSKEPKSGPASASWLKSAKICPKESFQHLNNQCLNNS